MLVDVEKFRWGDIRTFPRMTVETETDGNHIHIRLMRSATKAAGHILCEDGKVLWLGVGPEYRGGAVHRALLALAAARSHGSLCVTEQQLEGLNLQENTE